MNPHAPEAFRDNALEALDDRVLTACFMHILQLLDVCTRDRNDTGKTAIQNLIIMDEAHVLLSRPSGIERSDVYIANVVKCRPPNNRDPLPEEIEACKPWLEEQIALIDPKVIVTLGRFAGAFILDRPISITRIRGQRFPVDGRIVIPTLHPAAVLRGGEAQQALLREDFEAMKAAVNEPRGGQSARPAEPKPEPDEPPTEEQLGLF